MINQPHSPADNPQKILVIRFSSLGDVVLSMPLLHFLQVNYPTAQLDYLIRKEYAELVRNHPAVNRLIEFDVSEGFSGLLQLRKSLQSNGYHLVLDIHNNIRSRVLTFPVRRFKRVSRVRKNQFIRFLLVHFKLNLYRVFYERPPKVWQKYLRTISEEWRSWSRPEMTRVFLSRESRENVKGILKETGIASPFAVMAPGARHFTKRWPEHYYTELINRLYGKYKIPTILLGGPDEAGLAENIAKSARGYAAYSLAGKLTISETAAVIEQAEIMVTNDSGLMHLGAASNRKLVAIFGSTVEELGFFPETENALVVEEKELKCRPCSHIGRSQCPKKHFKCMLNLRPDNVFRQMEEAGFFTNLSR